MKSIDQVWDIYLEKGGKIDESSLRELSWHIEHDEDPWGAISMAADMIMESDSPLMKRVLIPAIAQQLHSEDSGTREIAIMSFRRMKVPKYGQDIYDMAISDPSEFARVIATRALGDIINEMEKSLKQQMAQIMYDVLVNEDFERYDKSYRDSASDSVLSAMGYNYLAFGRAWNDPDFDPIWKDFVKKYKLEYKPVFRR